MNKKHIIMMALIGIFMVGMTQDTFALSNVRLSTGEKVVADLGIREQEAIMKNVALTQFPECANAIEEANEVDEAELDISTASVSDIHVVYSGEKEDGENKVGLEMYNDGSYFTYVIANDSNLTVADLIGEGDLNVTSKTDDSGVSTCALGVGTGNYTFNSKGTASSYSTYTQYKNANVYAYWNTGTGVLQVTGLNYRIYKSTYDYFENKGSATMTGYNGSSYTQTLSASQYVKKETSSQAATLKYAGTNYYPYVVGGSTNYLPVTCSLTLTLRNNTLSASTN